MIKLKQWNEKSIYDRGWRESLLMNYALWLHTGSNQESNMLQLYANTRLDTHETNKTQKDTNPVQNTPIITSGTCKHTHSLRSRMCNYTYRTCSTHAHAWQCKWAAMRHARSMRDVRCRQYMITPADSTHDPGAPARTAG